MNHSKLAWLFVLLVAFLSSCNKESECCAQPASSKSVVASIGITGDTTDVQTTTQFGVVLMGGSTDVDEAIKWMIHKSGGGDFLIIRAGGSTGYNDYIKELGNVNSVETLLIDSREKANLPEVRKKLRNAEAVFIAGGDQSNYVNFWNDTEVSKAIHYLITTKRVPIGGTSAGCAVLSEYCFDAKNGGVTSEEALTDPYGNLVSISKSFIAIPVLTNVIADQHYSQRTRQGRHIVFLARLMKDFKLIDPVGIGVDEKTAVAVEADGSTKVFGTNMAHFLFPVTNPEQCEPNQKLNWEKNGRAIAVYSIQGNPSGTSGINLLNKPVSLPTKYYSVSNGLLKSE